VRRTLIVFAILSTMIVKAQNHSIITLITDRDCYTSGETILFKLQIPETEQSEIIKTDLTDTGGKIVTGVYNNTDDHQTDGFIYIPDSLQTGTYLICSHTRKNVLCTMKEVFICNRFIGFSETTSILRAREIKLVPENRLNEIRIEGVDSIYKTRSVVTAQIHPV
jgi:hypothetical protein